jgi:hypothetical protein
MDQVTKILIVLGVAALIGGAVGAFLDQWWKRRQRPRLQLVFDRTVDGCEVETRTAESEDAGQRHLRLKILNTGRSPAENVIVSITQIFFRPEGQGSSRTFKEEVLDLKVSLTDDYPVRVPAGGHRFLDICFTSNDAGAARFGLAFRGNPVRFQTFGFGRGAYTARVFASADGADSSHAEIKWKWDGTLKGLSAEGLGHLSDLSSAGY